MAPYLARTWHLDMAVSDTAAYLARTWHLDMADSDRGARP